MLFVFFDDCLIFILKFNCVIFKVRESDPSDCFREKVVQLLDDFKISGVNGTRILLFISTEQYRASESRISRASDSKPDSQGSMPELAKNLLCIVCTNGGWYTLNIGRGYNISQVPK